MKKWMKTLLVVIGISLVIGGCKANNQVDKQMPATGSDVLNTKSDFPITTEKITLKVMMPSRPYIQDINTNDYTKHYEEKTNIHIEWDVVSGDLNQKKNIVLASGSYPDVFMYCNMQPSEQVFYGNNDVLIPLNNLIDQHGKHIKKMIEDSPSMKRALTTPNGNIYGLPEIREDIVNHHSLKMWVYKPWLDKLGIELPNSTEQFYQMLKAFKEKDPNGNEKADEIPLAAINEVGSNNIYPYIMNAFIFHGWERPIYVEDNQVIFNSDKKETRDGLRFLRKLFAEELLARDSFTMDRKQRIALGENEDDVILGTAPGMHVGMFLTLDSEKGRENDYITIPPLTGPNGVKATGITKANVFGNMFNITRSCQYPEAAIRWIDYFYSFEGSREGAYGIEGAGWRKAEQGETDAMGNQALWKSLLSQSLVIQNEHWSQIVPPVNPKEWIAAVDDNELSEVYRTLSMETIEKYVPYGQDKEVPYMYFSEEESVELSEIETAIKSYIDSAKIQFITGIKDIDNDNEWNNYKNELKNIGLDRYLNIYQKAYDSYIKIN